MTLLLLRSTAAVLAALTMAGTGGARAQTQDNPARLAAAASPDRPTIVDPRPPIVLPVPRRGADAWTPVVRFAPGVIRNPPPTPASRYVAPGPATAAVVRPSSRPDQRASRTLSFFNVHTRESITVTYARNGSYVPSELARLTPFLRDSRDATGVAIDPALLDILWEVRQRLGSTASYHVMSGYRSPTTNAWLASVSSGVAANSLHMRGQAIDVMLPGSTAAQIGAAGHELNRGGVGYYPSSGYVHLDSGPVRSW